MDLGLKGCKAFLAGASKGLGKACAKALIDEGARVFICSRNASELEKTAKEIGAHGYAAADVSRPDEVKRVVAQGIKSLGGLDILVTNAGGPPTGPFEGASDQDWDIAYALNLMSSVRLIREALPALKASGRGRIVNLTGYQDNSFGLGALRHHRQQHCPGSDHDRPPYRSARSSRQGPRHHARGAVQALRRHDPGSSHG
jgi:NAD(P)-dependent dehydrogenase (short-subunit alcohol dehydrogenase family)